MLNTPITPPRVPLVDPRTGQIDRAWYLFFLSLNNTVVAVENSDVGPNADTLIATYDAALQTLAQEVGTQDTSSGLISQITELQKQVDALNSSPAPSLGTVTAVTATEPVVSSEGTAPDISLAAAYGDTQNPYAVKTANYVLAGPTTGAATLPTFRALVAADIPALPYQTLVAPVTYTANFTVAATDVWIINNKSGSSCTATLPAAASYTGRVLRFQNYQAQTLISASSNVVPLVGGAAGTAILAAVAGETCTLVSDGSNWVMTQYTPNNVLLLE